MAASFFSSRDPCSLLFALCSYVKRSGGNLAWRCPVLGAGESRWLLGIRSGRYSGGDNECWGGKPIVVREWMGCLDLAISAISGLPSVGPTLPFPWSVARGPLYSNNKYSSKKSCSTVSKCCCSRTTVDGDKDADDDDDRT